MIWYGSDTKVINITFSNESQQIENKKKVKSVTRTFTYAYAERSALDHSAILELLGEPLLYIWI